MAGPGFDWALPGWGEEDWGAIPPVPPVDLPLGPQPAGIRTLGLRGPGPLAHEIIGPQGTDFPKVVAHFEALEEAPGGYMTASGEVEAERVLDLRGVYTDGAVWIVTNAESGREVWRGWLQPPAITGGKAVLKADGPGKDPERTFGRLAYQVTAFSLWSPRNSSPYGASGDGYFDGPVAGVEKFQLSTDGKLSWTISKGTEIVDGNANGFILWIPGNEWVRVAFRINTTFPSPQYTIRFNVTTGPSGSFTQETYRPDLRTMTGTTMDVDHNLVNRGDLLNIQLNRELPSVPEGTGTDLEVWLTRLQVDSASRGDHVTTSQLVADLVGRMGFTTEAIQESGFNGLPFETGHGSHAEALDRLSLLTDWRWLALDRFEFGPWDTRVWTVVDPEFPVHIDPLPPMDQVVVPFVYANGAAEDELTVTSPTPLPKHRSFGQIALQGPLPDKEQAYQIGQRFLSHLIELRVAGTFRATEVLDANGNRHSADDMRAGDTIHFPLLGASGRIKSKRRTDGIVTGTLDSRLAVLDRILARRSQRIELRGLG